uniref:Uncharacterized protein n=1 Tax=Trepomonas sp. PC1 TaxID=1076344 RepID=A0A146K2E3_9EUKA|eukprot:JAP91062.1 hypothetical protein TPC1_17433 [Trepomonas sp. PC1]
MFTSRTDRKLHLEIPAGAHLSPQQYVTQFTSLKPLVKKPTCGKELFIPTGLEQELAKAQESPGIGAYNINHEPQYVRHQPEMAIFASLQERFQDTREVAQKTDVVTEENPIPQRQPVNPPRLEKELVDKLESIPTKPKQPLIRPENVQNVDIYNNPSPGDYDVTNNNPLPTTEQKIVPVTGGSSLTKYKHQSPWALSGQRFSDQNSMQGPRLHVPADKYEQQIQKQQNKIDQNVYTVSQTPEKELERPVEIINVQTGLSAKIKRQLEEMNKIAEIQQQRANQQLLNQKLHPSIGPNLVQEFQKYDPNSFYNSYTMQTPNPNQYQLQSNFKQNPVATYNQQLQQFSNLDKWQYQAPSIPIVEKTYVDKPPKVKNPSKGILEKQAPRDFQQKEEKYVHFYEVPVQKSAKMATCAFKNKVSRVKNAQLEQLERDTALKEQLQTTYFQKQTQKRQTGGDETVINFQLAKEQNATTKLYNNSAQSLEKIRSVKAQQNVEFYNIKNQPAKQITILKKERVLFTGQQKLPEISQAGPASKKALQLIAEKRIQNVMVGPGSYQLNAQAKRSFNAFSEENKIE